MWHAEFFSNFQYPLVSLDITLDNFKIPLEYHSNLGNTFGIPWNLQSYSTSRNYVL